MTVPQGSDGYTVTLHSRDKLGLTRENSRNTFLFIKHVNLTSGSDGRAGCLVTERFAFAGAACHCASGPDTSPWNVPSGSDLEDGDVPGEALHGLVQLPSLQPLLHRQIVKVLVELHR